MSDPEMTAAQKLCGEDSGHDWEWESPEPDVGISGCGICKLCGWTIPYEPPEFSDYL
jgi:hypothetical protein